MNEQILDTVIVGAGHAGLSTSYYLKQYGISHLVLERGRTGESWCSQRWDSFRLNTPNKMNGLPGDHFNGNNPEGFGTASELVDSMKSYVAKNQLPVAENTTVISIDKAVDKELFRVITLKDGNSHTYHCRQVVIASGGTNEMMVPHFATHLSPSIKQLHSSEYRNSDQLPEGAVLVVGSAQSGCQIAEDLADAGRKVYLSTSMVARIPRRYRDRDIHDWLVDMKFFDMRREDIPDPAMLHMKAPQLTGIDGGKTISLQSLSKKGIVLLGKTVNAIGEIISLEPNATMHAEFADGFSAKVKMMIDQFIQQNGIKAVDAGYDEADSLKIDRNSIDNIASLDTNQYNISAIIWATGLGGNFSYIRLPVFDETGQPELKNGKSAVKGLYFLGLHWLRNRKSTLLEGIKDDAEYVSKEIFKNATTSTKLVGDTLQ